MKAFLRRKTSEAQPSQSTPSSPRPAESTATPLYSRFASATTTPARPVVSGPMALAPRPRQDTSKSDTSRPRPRTASTSESAQEQPAPAQVPRKGSPMKALSPASARHALLAREQDPFAKMPIAIVAEKPEERSSGPSPDAGAGSNAPRIPSSVLPESSLRFSTPFFKSPSRHDKPLPPVTPPKVQAGLPETPLRRSRKLSKSDAQIPPMSSPSQPSPSTSSSPRGLPSPPLMSSPPPRISDLPLASPFAPSLTLPPEEKPGKRASFLGLSSSPSKTQRLTGSAGAFSVTTVNHPAKDTRLPSAAQRPPARQKQSVALNSEPARRHERQPDGPAAVYSPAAPASPPAPSPIPPPSSSPIPPPPSSGFIPSQRQPPATSSPPAAPPAKQPDRERRKLRKHNSMLKQERPEPPPQQAFDRDEHARHQHYHHHAVLHKNPRGDSHAPILTPPQSSDGHPVPTPISPTMPSVIPSTMYQPARNQGPVRGKPLIFATMGTENVNEVGMTNRQQQQQAPPPVRRGPLIFETQGAEERMSAQPPPSGNGQMSPGTPAGLSRMEIPSVRDDMDAHDQTDIARDPRDVDANRSTPPPASSNGRQMVPDPMRPSLQPVESPPLAAFRALPESRPQPVQPPSPLSPQTNARVLPEPRSQPVQPISPSSPQKAPHVLPESHLQPMQPASPLSPQTPQRAMSDARPRHKSLPHQLHHQPFQQFHAKPQPPLPPTPEDREDRVAPKRKHRPITPESPKTPLGPPIELEAKEISPPAEHTTEHEDSYGPSRHSMAQELDPDDFEAVEQSDAVSVSAPLPSPLSKHPTRPPTPPSPEEYSRARARRRGNALSKPPPDVMEAAKPKPPTFYPLAAHLQNPALLGSLLGYLTFAEWLALWSANKALRRTLDEMRDLREEVLERFLGVVGYARWAAREEEPAVRLTLGQLAAYMQGVSLPPHAYAQRAPSHERAHALRRATRAYSRVVLRLRAQAEAEEPAAAAAASPKQRAAGPPPAWANNYSQRSFSRASSRAPSPTGTLSTAAHGGARRFQSALFRVRRAPLLRVFVPSPEGDWLSDTSVLECEAELRRAGVLPLLRPGDVVWDTAVGDEGNAGRMVWDGRYLIDLDYTYSQTGDVPAYLPSLAFPPSYFHRVVRTAGEHKNPIAHLDISPWADEVAANLQLLQDRVKTETPQGNYHTVVRWTHRSSFQIVRPGSRRAPLIAIVMPTKERRTIDPGWVGTVVVEAEGTNEGLADLQRRCGTAFPPAVGGGLMAGRKGERERNVWRILRERSRPGEIWLRAVSYKERLIA